MQLSCLEVDSESLACPVVPVFDPFVKISGPHAKQAFGRDPPVGFVCAIVEEENPHGDDGEREGEYPESNPHEEADEIDCEVKHGCPPWRCRH